MGKQPGDYRAEQGALLALEMLVTQPLPVWIQLVMMEWLQGHSIFLQETIQVSGTNLGNVFWKRKSATYRAIEFPLLVHG